VRLELTQGDVRHDVFFTAPRKMNPYGDALGALSLLPAMTAGALHIDGRVSPQLLDGFQRVQEIFNFWDLHGPVVPVKLQPIRVDARPMRRLRPRSGRGVASFFTGGVDSLYTALSHQDEIDTLVYVHGFDIGLTSESLRALVGERLGEAAANLGMGLVEVVTNLRRYSDLFVPWQLYHGAALAGVALLLKQHFRRFYIPATLTFANLAPLGSHPLVDRLWSTEDLEIVHDGCEATRDEKLERIGRYPELLEHLRVCLANGEGIYNCGRCEKCLRTMVALRLTGLDGRVSSLPLLDIDQLAGVALPENTFTWSHMRDRAKRSSAHEDLAAALDSLLNPPWCPGPLDSTPAGC